MDEDVPMDEDAAPGDAEKPKDGDDLAEYNLDDYDNEDDMPCNYFSIPFLL